MSSANDSLSESFAPPTESTALGLDACSTPHYSLSQSGEVVLYVLVEQRFSLSAYR